MTSHGTGGVTPTLNAFDMGDTRATVVICYPINTMTLGGRPDPMNDARMTLGVGDEGDPQFTISSSHPHAVAIYPIDDGREMEKKQNGTGIGEEGAPSYTLDRAQHASVAFYSTDGGFGAKDDNLAPSTKVGGVTAMATISPTLTAYNMDSRSPQSEESQRIVQSVHETISVVRRLTPTECERLQGFPDGWTESQTDGHRYKQMGNAVAVPVVEWIMERLVACDEMV